MKEIHQVPSIFNLAICDSEYKIPNNEWTFDNIPNLNEAIEIEDIDCKDLNISLSKNGRLTGNEIALSLLDFYDEAKLNSYNSVIGKEAGLKQCYFSTPSLIKEGTAKTKYICKNIGFNFSINEKQLEKLKDIWDVRATPLYQPKSYELLAYFNYGFYLSKSDLKDENGEVIFKEGVKYLIKPTWGKHNQVIDSEIDDSNDGEEFEIIRQVETGHLELHVFSEKDIEVFPENNKERIELFLSIFDLPKIKGIADKYPNRVRNWVHIISKKYPFLKEYQMEDLARLLCKQKNYVGYQQGGGKTLMAFCYAELRQFKRSLVICEGGLVDNWINEAKKWGFTATAIRKHSDIDELKKRIKQNDFVKNKTEFFIIGQEFLSLDGGRVFDTWECIKFDKDGKLIHHEISNKFKCPKGHKYDIMNKKCPKCGDYHLWTGKFCGSCGYIPYTYGIGDNGISGTRQYPAYKRLKKLFSFVTTDESQNFANRSLRGEASRVFTPKAKMLLTGTIMKNYVSDVFLNIGWLMGYNNPVFYYNRGDVKRFLDEFGSYEFITKKYINEIKNADSKNRKGGRKKLLPAVSNLNRFWKVITPFTVRRLSKDLEGLKDIERERTIEVLPMDTEHSIFYQDLQNWARETLEKEFRKKDNSQVNMGVISAVLWKLRYGATMPTSQKLLDGNANCPKVKLDKTKWNKIERVLQICTNARNKGDKVIVFSGLRAMQSYLARILKNHGFRVKFVPSAVDTKKRFAEIEDFGKNYDVLVSGSDVLNRGYNIISANHVVFTDLTYVPEITDQGEFRVIRLGQTKKVFLHYLLSLGTIDEDMLVVNDDKRDAIEKAIDKKVDEQQIKDLLKQADTRNAELMVAKSILKNSDTRMKSMIDQITNIYVEEQVEEIKTNFVPQKETVFGDQLSLF